MTDKCNLNCPYCMRGQFTPPNGRFTLEKMKSLLKRMPYINGVCIMGLCEPFLNPDTPEIVRWLKDEGNYSLSLTTNGMVPLTSDMLECLLRVDDFVFSIDSADETTFKFLRGGADLKTVVGNMERLIRYKMSLGLGRMDNPPIHINAVITSRNFHQIPDLIRMLENYAADLTYLMIDPVTRPDYQSFEQPFVLQKDFEQYVPEYRRIAERSPLQVVGFDWMFAESIGWRDCCLAWNAMFLEPNGDVYFCYHYDYVLGNVFEEDPLKIWNNSLATSFRKNLRLATPPLKQCRSCNFARKGWQPEVGTYLKRAEDVKG